MLLRYRWTMVTVTGTENLLMAAVLAEGQTVLENAAREPEVVDLAELLIKMGAQIQGHGTDRIVIEGVKSLHGATHRVIPDRIEAGSFLCAVGAAGGDITLRKVAPDTMGATLSKLQEAGLTLTCGPDWIRASMIPLTRRTPFSVEPRRRKQLSLQHKREDSNPVYQFWRLTALPGARSCGTGVRDQESGISN